MAKILPFPKQSHPAEVTGTRIVGLLCMDGQEIDVQGPLCSCCGLYLLTYPCGLRVYATAEALGALLAGGV